MSLLQHPFTDQYRVKQDTSATALAFVINSPFVPALRVLLKSLAMNNTLVSCPIILITEDEAVRQAEGIAEYVDEWYIAKGDDINQFNNIGNNHVAPRYRLDWIPKYTYMKWNIFRDWGYERIIFIDADILCLGDLSALIEHETRGVAAAAMFKPELVVKNDQAETDRRILDYGLGYDPKNMRVNSGVMVIGPDALNDGFRRNLIRFTEVADSYSVEQAALRQFMTQDSGLGLDTFPPIYNFKSLAVGKISPNLQLDVLSKVKLLHFAGLPRRPWEMETPQDLAASLWFQYAEWPAPAMP